MKILKVAKVFKIVLILPNRSSHKLPEASTGDLNVSRFFKITKGFENHLEIVGNLLILLKIFQILLEDF